MIKKVKNAGLNTKICECYIEYINMKDDLVG